MLEEVAIWVCAGCRRRHGGGHLCLGAPRRSLRGPEQGRLCQHSGAVAAARITLLFWALRLRTAGKFRSRCCACRCSSILFLRATVTFVQGEVDPGARVISGALLLLVMNLVGLGLGPTFVGMASDFFRPQYGEHALQVAFYALAPMYLVAAMLFLWLARLIRQSSSPVAGTRPGAG